MLLKIIYIVIRQAFSAKWQHCIFSPVIDIEQWRPVASALSLSLLPFINAPIEIRRSIFFAAGIKRTNEHQRKLCGAAFFGPIPMPVPPPRRRQYYFVSRYFVIDIASLA